MKTFRDLRKRLLWEITTEREEQITHCQHGGDTDKFDKNNTKNDWVAYIMAYAGRGAAAHINEKEGQCFRDRMIKVAALSLAALEAYDKGWC